MADDIINDEQVTSINIVKYAMLIQDSDITYHIFGSSIYPVVDAKRIWLLEGPLKNAELMAWSEAILVDERFIIGIDAKIAMVKIWQRAWPELCQLKAGLSPLSGNEFRAWHCGLEAISDGQVLAGETTLRHAGLCLLYTSPSPRDRG